MTSSNQTSMEINNNINNDYIDNKHPYYNDYPVNSMQLPSQYSPIRGYNYAAMISRYSPYGIMNNDVSLNKLITSVPIHSTQTPLLSTTISSVLPNATSTIQHTQTQSSTIQSTAQQLPYYKKNGHTNHYDKINHTNNNNNNNNNDDDNNNSNARNILSHYNTSSKSSSSTPLQSFSKHNEFGIIIGQAGSSLRSIDWRKFTLPEFQKNFYRESLNVSGMKENEIQEWRQQNRISVVGENVPKPIRSFEESGFPSYIMTEIKHAGFEFPTPIQSQGWPMAMSGRDLVGIAETGSGKTLAFLLPSIVHINAQPLLRPGDGPIVLIITPTRELAMQINDEAKKFASSSRIKHICVYGGVPRREQSFALRSGVEICICTPGRLLDFLENKQTNLRRVTYLVIDEADRLLDLGFEPQLQAILSQVRPDRQILMWSATWPKEVRALANSFMNTKEALQVAIGSFDTKANHDVLQTIEVIEQENKQKRLFDILNKELKTNNYNHNHNHHHYSNNDDDNDDKLQPKILVFTSTKVSCNRLVSILRYDGWPVTAIHGDKEQNERDYALKEFKNGKASIMLATDVASRGIHIDDITLVINFDFPTNIEDYVHRIGRTGRCGKKGKSVSFFTKGDSKRAPALVDILVEAQQIVPPELMKISFLEKPSKNTRYARSKQQNHNHHDNFIHNHNNHNNNDHNNHHYNNSSNHYKNNYNNNDSDNHDNNIVNNKYHTYNQTHSS